MTFKSGDILERRDIRYILSSVDPSMGDGNWTAHKFSKAWGTWLPYAKAYSVGIYPHMLVRDGWTHVPYEGEHNATDSNKKSSMWLD